jgi:exopolyphosphatase/guanosine-5'-triphosphate,3'-diphosphate pyrophosphatase
MRLGVLDVGSNTVHLLVVDAHPGARPTAAHSHKTELRLLEHLEPDGRLDAPCADRLLAAVAEAVEIAEDLGVEEMLAFATSALRDATNGEEMLSAIRERTGVSLEALPGPDEARLTFLAVRRWFGWSAGRLLVVDIGGGSLELACGIDEEPDAAVSLPLGAARLTRTAFTSDPPDPDEVRALRRAVRTEIARDVGSLTRFGPPDFAVATSKTFKQLARMAGAAPTSEGPYVRRSLQHTELVHWLTKMAEMSSAERAALPGVSTGRARQLLAGAIVADAVMGLFGIHELEICPWALREGLILRRLDLLLDSARQA